MGRRFSVEYKERVLAELDAALAPGERGAILRREGLYWSTVSRWRQRRDAAVREGLREGKRGPKGDRLAQENRALRERNEQLEERLRIAEEMIEAEVVQTCPDSRWWLSGTPGIGCNASNSFSFASALASLKVASGVLP